MPLTENRLVNLMDMLIGTNLELENMMKDFAFTLSDENLEQLNETIFKCKSCGFWFELLTAENGECETCEMIAEDLCDLMCPDYEEEEDVCETCDDFDDCEDCRYR